VSSNATIDLLARIAVAAEKTAAATERCAASLERMEKRRPVGGAASQAGAPAVADDTDLDSKYGDPEVKKDPPRWKGALTAPIRMSECTPEYLDFLAQFYDWCAGKELDKNEQKKASYKRRDAARARGWAQRIRAGWRPPAQEEQAPADFDDGQSANGGW
jgi:hypothetical protein